MWKTSILVLGLAAACLRAESEGTSSRLNRIQSLLGAAQAELDSLQKEANPSTALPSIAPERSEPMAEDLLTEKQKKIARATRTSYRRSAAGYVFNPDFQGMDLIQWWEDWGSKLDATVHVTRYAPRNAGVNLSALRSLNRFSFLDGAIETHLYAFTGMGFYWERFQDMYGGWYTTPNVIGHWQLGAGTELSLGFLGGVKFSPEVGLQASDYLKRYEDSQEWSVQNPFPRPRSDFSLDVYYAFHFNFYFR